MILSQSEKEKLWDLYLQFEHDPYREKRIFYPSWPLLNRHERLIHSDYTELREERFIAYEPWQRRTFLASILIKGKKFVEQNLAAGG